MPTKSPQQSALEFRAIFAIAMGHQTGGRFAEAEAAYRQLITMRPELGGLYNNLGCALQAQGKIKLAQQSYQQAVRLSPDDAMAVHNLGCTLNMNGRLDEAAVCYERAIALDPKHAEAHGNLGAVLLDRGKLDEAERECREAVGLAPRSAVFHNTLGNVLKAKSQIDRAMECYQHSLALDPKYADAHNNLGCLGLDQGKLQEAALSFGRAVLLRPGYAEAHCNLGVALKDMGDLDQATACFTNAIRLKPDYPEPYNNLSSVLAEQGRLTEALASCRKAIALSGDFAGAHCNQGNILQTLGKLSESTASFQRAARLKPGYPEAAYNLAHLKKFKRDDPELTDLESLENKIDLVPYTKRPYVYFALGKAMEDIGDYGRAFARLQQGSRIKRELLQYDAAASREHLQLIANVFSSWRLRSYEGAGNPAMTPIFILGMPRSGSTLIEQILSSHPQVYGAGELKSLSILANSIGKEGYPVNCTTLESDRLRELGEAYLKSIPPLPPGTTRFTDKMPGNFIYAGLIHMMLSNAKIIHTVRNPVDTCMSCYSRIFTNGMAWTYDLSELGKYYRDYRQLMDHWKSVLPEGTMMDVAYESVVDDLERESRRLLAYCGLPWDERVLDFHRNSRPVSTASSVTVRQPVFTTSVDRWKRFESHLKPLLDEF